MVPDLEDAVYCRRGLDVSIRKQRHGNGMSNIMWRRSVFDMSYIRGIVVFEANNDIKIYISIHQVFLHINTMIIR